MTENPRISRTYRLPAGLVKRLDVVCAILGVSKETYIEEALTEKLAADEPQAMASYPTPTKSKVARLRSRRPYSTPDTASRGDFPKVAEPQGSEVSQDG